MVYRSVDQEGLLQQGVPLEDRSFTFVINSCGRSALWRDAMQVFKMCTPNVIIYNAAITAVTTQWLVLAGLMFVRFVLFITPLNFNLEQLFRQEYHLPSSFCSCLYPPPSSDYSGG